MVSEDGNLLAFEHSFILFQSFSYAKKFLFDDIILLLRGIELSRKESDGLVLLNKSR